ncbi:Alpha/Beta hydrolase protein [Schizophyllum commune]
MLRLDLLLSASSIAAVAALEAKRDPEGITWFSCSVLDPLYGVVGPALNASCMCGYHDVPLDYADESVGIARLAVGIYPATAERWGTVFINPGGPGLSGIEFLFEYGPHISVATGGHYDVVSWDPRGSTGQTTPEAPSCFSTPTDKIEFFKGTLEATGIDIKGNLSDYDQIDELYSHVEEMEAKYVELGKRCAQGEKGKTLPYLGTAATVRDMVALADVLDPGVDEINYWGFSYGTMLGLTFVNMFPDRVGHVVLDGCMNPILYADRPSTEYLPNLVEGTDGAFAGFAAGCAAAGKEGCALVINGNETAADIIASVQGLLDLAHELVVAGVDMSKTPTSAEFRGLLNGAMYAPSLWSSLATEIAVYAPALELLATNQTIPPALASLLAQAKSDFTTSPKYGLQAVTCADSVDAGNMTMRGAFDAIVNASTNVSPMFGPQWGTPGALCFAWPARAVERYTGPWNNKLKNTILVIGNTFDSATPFQNAQLMADLLGDSAVLLEQVGYGHSSLAEQSSCTIGIVAEYFTNGSLPEGDGTKCDIDDTVVLFPKSNVTQATVRRSILAAEGRQL